MSRAVCKECARIVGWSARRGVKLSDHRCPHCGGSLHGMTAGRPTVGGKIKECALCSRRRRERNLTLLTVPARFLVTYYPEGKLYFVDSREAEVLIPAGQYVCGYHDRDATLSFRVPVRHSTAPARFIVRGD